MLLVHCLGNVFYSKTIELTKKATGSGILPLVFYYEVKSWFFSQGNQIGYDSKGGIMNYTL